MQTQLDQAATLLLCYGAALPKELYVAKTQTDLKGSLMNSTRRPAKWAMPAVGKQTFGN